MSNNRGNGTRWRGRRPWLRGRGRFKNFKQNTRPGNVHNEDIADSSSGDGPSQSNLSDHFESVTGPYEGWNLYFTEHYRDGHQAVSMIQIFEGYFKRNIKQYNLEDVENRGSFVVDLEKLKLDSEIRSKIPNLDTELISNPETYLRNMSIAMHQIIVSEHAKEDEWLRNNAGGSDEDDPEDYNHSDDVFKLKKIQARIINAGCRLPFSELKAIYIGKLVNIHGTVVRVTEIKPMVTKMPYKCGACDRIQMSVFPDGKCVIPKSCPSRECRGKFFTAVNRCDLIQSVDWQTLKIQEINDNVCDVGRVPRIIECEVHSDLVDSCVPGDVVNITGLIKVSNNNENGAKYNQDKCLFLLCIEANSICNSNGKVGGLSQVSSSSRQCSNVGMEFSMKDFFAIREIQEQKNLFRLIIYSLCPAIYGHEMVKAGLTLALFGGTQRFLKDEYRMMNRANSHVLVVGDPGLGKSQMLKACANVSPRGVYVCGSTATTTGLTVTMTKDAQGESSLEAGALVFADMGCCCVDEFDKMGQQQHALLEAMEQQTISIAKAGITCTLPSRTSILAAANPVEGHYNKAKTVSENLKISGALLSRFDLVFIIIDKPDEEIDSMLTEHLMALHGGGFRPKALIKPKTSNESRISLEGESSLKESLRLKAGESIDPIPHQLLKKYIGYARQYIQTKLSPGAATILKQFYLDLRKNHRDATSTPITTRQLESLIRLTEARAKLELREEATEDDAKEVVEIMKHSMIDTYSDELGFLDFSRSQNGSGMSQRSQAMRLLTILTKEAKRTDNSYLTVQRIKDLVKESGLQINDLNQALDSLNDHNYLLKKGPKIYQLLNI